jgi:hypothetical protein
VGRLIGWGGGLHLQRSALKADGCDSYLERFMKNICDTCEDLRKPSMKFYKVSRRFVRNRENSPVFLKNCGTFQPVMKALRQSLGSSEG